MDTNGGTNPGLRAWVVVVRSPLPAGRYRPPEVIEAQGEDEAAALTYLAVALEERRGDERRIEIARRARLTYVAGAEGSWPPSSRARRLTPSSKR